MKVYLIISLFNEEKYIDNFLKGLQIIIKKLPEIETIVIVDDGSTDKSISNIKYPASTQRGEQISKRQIKNQKDRVKFIILNHAENKGKGEAMKTGLNYAKKNRADAVIFMDSDGQHDPQYLPTFIKSLQHDHVVFGYRHFSSEAPLIRKLGNIVAGQLIHNVFGIKRKDLLCGFMGFSKDVFNVLHWESKGYGVETELSVIIGRKKIKYGEIFIKTIYYDPNKGVNLIHALEILLKIPYWFLKYH